MGEIIVPKIGKKFGYVVTRKYKVGIQELRQIVAFYMQGSKFFATQWCRNADGSGDYKNYQTLEVSREEYFANFFYDNDVPSKPRVGAKPKAAVK